MTGETPDLLTELVVGITRRLRMVLGSSRRAHQPEGYIHHNYESVFEGACSILWHFGIAVATRDGVNELHEADDDLPFPPYFRLIPQDDVRAAMENAKPVNADRLEYVLEKYICLACGYGPRAESLSDSRDAFVPPASAADEVEALVSAGYLAKEGEKVIWTDKIAPVMSDLLLWRNEMI